jgi:hypothetical protein
MICKPISEMHAYEGFCEDLARQNIVAHLSQLQLGFGVVTYGLRVVTYGLRVVTYGGFSHRCSVLKATI